MAINCEIIRTTTGITYPNAHVVIGAYIEINKEVLCVSTNVWSTKQDYLDKLAPIDSIRHVIDITQLVQKTNFRETLYTYLMLQPEYINPIADMNNDFPITSIII